MNSWLYVMSGAYTGYDKYLEKCQEIKSACENAQSEKEVIDAIETISPFYNGWVTCCQILAAKCVTEETREAFHRMVEIRVAKEDRNKVLRLLK